MSEVLRPPERIRKQRDFIRLYRKGNRFRGTYFTLVYLPNDLGYSRLGVVASRKVGNAVARNKAKRWMRALFRRNKPKLCAPLDLILIAKPHMRKAEWSGLREEYLRAIQFANRKSRAS